MPKIFVLRHQLAEQQAKLKLHDKGDSSANSPPLSDDEKLEAVASRRVQQQPHQQLPSASSSAFRDSDLQLQLPPAPGGLVIQPISQTDSNHGPVRTLAARKAFDEPLDVSIRRKEKEARYHPYSRNEQEGPINLQVPKWPKAQVFNNGELTIVRRPPSPPQDEPVDFSTKKKPLTEPTTLLKPTFTSTKELRFAKNLKLLLVEIMRKDPTKARIILDYLRHSWRKCKNGVRQCTATGQPPSFVQSSGGSGSSSANNGSGGGSSSSNSGSGGGNSSGDRSGGQSSGGSGGNSGGGDGRYGGGSSGSGGGGAGGGGGVSGGGSGTGGGGGPGDRKTNPSQHQQRGTILDMDLDFEDLPAPATAKWFSDHPDINAGKVLDGLLSLKTEFPEETTSNNSSGPEKPPELTSLDHATANLLQMSVPDPSTTFLDIGTDIGGTSLYEDDPFNLEHLLPSNFNISQLDLLPSSPDHTHAGHIHAHGSGQHSQHMAAALAAHGSEASMTLTAKNIVENNNSSSSSQLGMPVSTAISMSLYPETTISPMGGHPLRGLEPIPASSLKGVIKTEPTTIPYIKREDNNNGMPQHPSHHHHHHLDSYPHLTPGVSPMSSGGSMGSPGSPPMYDKVPTAMAIAALAGRQGIHPGAQPSSYGGGKMKSPGPSSASPSSSNRKKAAPPPSTTTQEEDDLTNIPSLQMRIKVLQQRLGLPPETPVELINGGFGIKNPLASDIDPVRAAEKMPVARAEIDPSKFQCRLCSKSFTLQRLLNRHMKCHSDTKRYLCTFCGKGFNDTFDLKRHTRTHTGVRPYKCNLCEKSFTQRCSLESHCLKVHGVAHNYEYKQRRSKMYVCEDCGHTTKEPELHYLHLKEKHPYSPALLKFYDKRHFKFNNTSFASMLLQVNS